MPAVLHSCGTIAALDTSTTARKRQCEALRRVTPEQRLASAAELSDEIRLITEAGSRRRHPAWTDDEVRGELVAIVLGREIAAPLRARRVVPGR